MADQGVNALSNVALVAFAAMGSTAEGFGRFAIAYAFFVFFLGAARALVGETALVFERGGASRARAERIAGASVWVAVPGAVALAAIALAVPGDERGVWLALAAGTLVAIVQDAYRYVALVEQRPLVALALDVVWTVPALAAMAVLAQARAGSAAIVLAWSAGALLSLGCAALLARAAPRVDRGWGWLRANRRSALRYVAEFSALNGSTLAVWVLLAPLVGAVGVGALRGAQLLFSPLNTVFSSLRIAMIPELARAAGTPRYARRLVELALVLIVGALVWGGAVLLLGDGVGRALLGPTWDGVNGLRAAFFVQYVLLAGYTLLLTVFRVRLLDNASSIMRGVLAVATLAVPLALAAALGVAGAAAGLAIAVGAAVATGATALAWAARRGRA